MISIVIFALTLIAGSVFAEVFYRRDFSDTLPLSMTGIILFLYIFGLIGALKTGVYLILIIAAFMLVLSVARLIREKRAVDYIKKGFGFAGLLFVLLYIVFLVLNVGRLAWYHDELSHWMDCVKAMSQTDGFAANYTVSYSEFPSYPPGMALFQYFFQKLHEIFEGTSAFCEWRPYVAFQLFAVSLFFPCLKRLDYHKALKPVLLGVTMLLPLIMYPTFFAAVLIDPMIGILSGAGYVYLFMCRDEKTSEKAIYISLLCAVLVLMKDSGLFFTVFLALVFLVDVLLGSRSMHASGSRKRKAGIFLQVFSPFAVFLLIKGSWNLVLQHFQTPSSFSNSIRVGEYLKLFFAGGDETYKQETVDKFKEAFFDSNGFNVHTGFSVSYFVVLLILLLATAGLTLWLYKKEKEKNIIRMSIILSIQTVLYVFFLGAVYISSFNEYEATTLASYDRYIRMALLPQFLFLIWMLFRCIQYRMVYWKYGLTILLTGIIVAISPFAALKGFITRLSVQDSIAQREPYRELQEAIENECDGNDQMIYLSGYQAIYDQHMFVFISRPNRIADFCYIHQDQTENNQWIRDYVLNNFRYVAVNEANEAMTEVFKGYMSSSDSIQSKTLYRVNRNTGRLEAIRK